VSSDLIRCLYSLRYQRISLVENWIKTHIVIPKPFYKKRFGRLSQRQQALYTVMEEISGEKALSSMSSPSRLNTRDRKQIRHLEALDIFLVDELSDENKANLSNLAQVVENSSIGLIQPVTSDVGQSRLWHLHDISAKVQ